MMATREPVTARSLDNVLQLHQLTANDLRGKTILDLGCGRSNLQAELQARQIGAIIVGIDKTDVALWGGRPIDDGGTRFAQAELAALPVRDGSVDIALATYSLPYWAHSREDVDGFFSECARVVRYGGLISIAPMVSAEHLPAAPDDTGLDYTPYMSARQAFAKGQWQELYRKNATYAIRKTGR